MVFHRLNPLLYFVKLKAWHLRHERLLVSAFLVGGFFLHFFTFRSLEVQVMLIGLAIYLLIAALSILYIFFFDAWPQADHHPFLQRLRLIAPLLTQLAFGSLLSMSLLFYWFSGTFIVSWPIFALLIVLILLNEKFRHIYLRPVVQVTLFSFVLLAYFILLFPFWFNSLAPGVVLAGGIVGLILALLYVHLLLRIAPELHSMRKKMVASICSMFVAIGILYFLNLIPPVPLSLRDAGIYHSVKRVANSYELAGEPQTFLEYVFPGQTIHEDSSGRIYAFTAVYSPADLDTQIYHQWEFYDPAQHKWIKKDRLSFFITGGRIDGYHGYTYKTHLEAGKWRVSVKTARGQVLGVIPFTYVSWSGL